MKCPECDYDKDIRRDLCKELNGSNLVYYRCKSCGYMWDNGEHNNKVINNER